MDPSHVPHGRKRRATEPYVRIGPGKVLGREVGVRSAADFEVGAESPQTLRERGMCGRADDDAARVRQGGSGHWTLTFLRHNLKPSQLKMLVQRERCSNPPLIHDLEAHGVGQADRLITERLSQPSTARRSRFRSTKTTSWVAS